MRCAVRHWRNRPGVGVLPALVRPSGTSTYMCARARLGLRLYIKVTCALGSGLVRDGALVFYVILFFIYNLYNLKNDLKNDPKSESGTDTHCAADRADRAPRAARPARAPHRGAARPTATHPADPRTPHVALRYLHQPVQLRRSYKPRRLPYCAIKSSSRHLDVVACTLLAAAACWLCLLTIPAQRVGNCASADHTSRWFNFGSGRSRAQFARKSFEGRATGESTLLISNHSAVVRPFGDPYALSLSAAIFSY